MAHFKENHNVIGECQLMCPVEETDMREKQGLIHPFEAWKGADKRSQRYQADRSKLVKRYSRPAAGRLDPRPQELRPAPVLFLTTEYLIKQVVTKSDCPWHMVYDYVFDRLRAVRQDLTIQQLEDTSTMCVLQRTVHFLIYANYRLCTEEMRHFDGNINETHIQECLQKLLVSGRPDNMCVCQEARVVALYVLFNVDSWEALTLALDRKQRLGQELVFRLALAVSLAWLKKRYSQVFRLIRQLPALMACALHHRLPAIIRETLAVMSVAYSSKALRYSLRDLSALLNVDSDTEVRALCADCSLTLVGDAVCFNKVTFKVDKVPQRHFAFIDEKLREENPVSAILQNSDVSCHRCLGST